MLIYGNYANQIFKINYFQVFKINFIMCLTQSKFLITYTQYFCEFPFIPDKEQLLDKIRNISNNNTFNENKPLQSKFCVFTAV